MTLTLTLTLAQYLRLAIMDMEFVNYSHSQHGQQESVTPENMWTVSRIAESEELTMTAIHGPSVMEVSGIPVTQELVQLFSF